MARVTIINGHPDSDRGHFCSALAAEYERGARARHETRRIDIGKLEFSDLRNQDEWKNSLPPSDVAEAQEAIRWADHLVLVYPMWLGDVPARLKAFLEQVARPDFAFGDTKRGSRLPEKKLSGRSAKIIVTMGMPALFYRLFYRAHSLKNLERNILKFCGFGPVRHSIVGSVEKGADHRAAWLKRVRSLGAAAT